MIYTSEPSQIMHATLNDRSACANRGCRESYPPQDHMVKTGDSKILEEDTQGSLLKTNQAVKMSAEDTQDTFSH